MSEVRVGVVGGSGLYDMDGLEILAERVVETPFGSPSGPYVIGRLGDRSVAFLARHGRGHRIMPSEINFRANIFGFKTLGVEWLISVSAVGSMQPDYEPTDIVVPDQFYDRTRHRSDTFFGDGLVAHVSMADPVCPELRKVLLDAAVGAGAKVHDGGTYLCMEGPQFSTRAESRIYRQWGIDVIGMTNLQEAKLAREAEISYATLAMVTDYDCWHDDEEDVEVANLLEVLRSNAELAQEVVAGVVGNLDLSRPCPWAGSLRHSIITDPGAVPEETRARLEPIVGRYLEPAATERAGEE
jgi:5'-methylthioadenosine phosphorylase